MDDRVDTSTPDVADSESPAGPCGPVEFRVENLRKSFEGNRVLAGVSLEVYRGDTVAIVGGSGCGKTVLLEHVIGHMEPDSGRVLVADHEDDGAPLRDLAGLDEEQMNHIRRHWAVVFQRNALFSGSVYENIALWLEEIRRLGAAEITAIARRALTDVGFDDPDEVLDIDRDNLSGGMAKRVAIARAVAMDPLLIFYDEPTTGLDPRHASQIHELIRSTQESGTVRTSVIITHDKDLLRRLRPRIIMLDEGRVHFDGPFEAFERSDSPIIRPYFDLMPVLQSRLLRG